MAIGSDMFLDKIKKKKMETTVEFRKVKSPLVLIVCVC